MKDQRNTPTGSGTHRRSGEELPAVGKPSRALQRRATGRAPEPAFRGGRVGEAPVAEAPVAEPVLIAHGTGPVQMRPAPRSPGEGAFPELQEVAEKAKYMDPAGDADRDKARDELAKKLTIIDDDFEGERLPNMVTRAEFEQIVKLYSDIRLGRSDIKLDPGASKDPDAFEKNMMDDLGDILQTEIGRELIAGLADNTSEDEDGNEIHHSTTLFPNLDQSADADTSGAWTMEYGDGAAIAMNPNMDVGTGDASIRSDVALFHELVHAHHFIAGTRAEGNVEASDALTHATNTGDIWGIAGQLANPDSRVALDATETDKVAAIERAEHQASGLGVHADDPLTENAYRAERRDVARSGQGLAGDRGMPRREGYRGGSGTGHHRDEKKKGKKRRKGRKGKTRT
jgi:hypothetical protein